jgi:hypothetical protein
MRSMLLGFLLALATVAPVAAAEQRRNLSIEDVISGFEEEKLFYFELLLQNGKYIKGFNRCLGSKPAAAEWIRQHGKKNPEFKHAFECSADNQLIHIWFVYENAVQCEEIRGPTKDRMDAVQTQ